MSTNLKRVGISFADTGSRDSFGRGRFSEPFPLFSAKHLHDKLPTLFDERDSGGAETSVHVKADSCVRMSVANAGEYVVRQSWQRFYYQSGLSKAVALTATLGPQVPQTSKILGYFNSSTVAPYSTLYDGIFFRDNGTDYEWVVSKDGAEDSEARDGWNGDLPATYDFTKSTIFIIDLQWLGVGRVRVGVDIDGEFVLCHEFKHAGLVDSVYMQTPNHSVRYEIRSTGGAASMDMICSAVLLEGGERPIGEVRTYNTGIAPADSIDMTVDGEFYAVAGIRLQGDRLDAIIRLSGFSLLCTTSDDLLWEIRRNPNVAGTFNYAPVSDTSVECARGDSTTNPSSSVVTGGEMLDSGYISASSDTIRIDRPVINPPGASIDGEAEELVLCVAKSGGPEDIFGGLTWRESF